MPIFILFPSMGVWAMRGRLRYFIQPLYAVEGDSDGIERAVAYQKAQQLKEKIQAQIIQILRVCR